MNYERPIGIYEKALYKKPLGQMFQDAAICGFDCFEISIDETGERIARLDESYAALRQYRDTALDTGIRLYSLCFSAQRRYPMGSKKKEIRDYSMRLFKKALHFCEILGIRVLQVAGYDVFYEPHSEVTEKWFYENLEICTNMAGAAGIMLAIEPVEAYITSVTIAKKIISQIQSPWLTVYPDTANLYRMGYDVTEEIRNGKGIITAVHMREAPDDAYIPFGQGKLSFPTIIRTLDEIQFFGPLIIELWNEDNPEYMKIVSKEREYLQILMKQQSGKRGPICMN